MKNHIIGLVLIAVLALVLFLAPRINQTSNNNTNTAVVTDYTSCVTAGFTIAGTTAKTCTTPDGRVFTDTTVVTEPDVVIDTPEIAQIVTSPMTVKGKVMNTWFFEANIPIELRDENGKVLVQKGYMTSDDWMTPGYKTLDTTLSFKAPTTDYGVLIIHNDNPSGLPENDKKFEVPVRFK